MPTQQPPTSPRESAKANPAKGHVPKPNRAVWSFGAVPSPRKDNMWREKRGSRAPAQGDTLWEDASTEAGDGTPEASCSVSPVRERAPRSPSRPLAKKPQVEQEVVGHVAGRPPQPFGHPPEKPAEGELPGTTTSPPKSPVELSEELVKHGLAKLLAQMAAMSPAPPRRTPFESKFPPSISIKDYVERVIRFSRCCPACVVVSLAYLDRLLKLHPCIVVGPLTCHRLVLTSVMLAIKFNDDVYYSNAFYSKVGGVQLTELNSLEKSFLKLVDFKLSLSPQEYDLYRDMLLRALQLDAGDTPDAPAQVA